MEVNISSRREFSRRSVHTPEARRLMFDETILGRLLERSGGAMETNPLLDFVHESTFDEATHAATRAFKVAHTRAYEAALIIARELLAKHGISPSATTSPEEVISETVLRIQKGGRGYDRRISETGTLEPMNDAFLMRCMDRTASSMRSEKQKMTRRARFDGDVKRLHYNDLGAGFETSGSQESHAIAEDTFKSFLASLSVSRIGRHMRVYASNLLRYVAEGPTNKEIAEELKVPIGTVNQLRGRLRDHVARVKTEGKVPE